VAYLSSIESVAVSGLGENVHIFGIDEDGFKKGSIEYECYSIKAFLELDARQNLICLDTNEGSLKVWDLSSDKLIRTLEIHEDKHICYVNKILFDHEKNVIILGNDYVGDIKFIDFETGKTIDEIGVGKRIYQIEYIQSKRYLVFRGDDSVIVKKVDFTTEGSKVSKVSMSHVARFYAKSCGVHSMAINEDPMWIVMDGGDSIMFFDLEGKQSKEVTTFAKTISCILHIPEHKKLILGDYF